MKLEEMRDALEKTETELRTRGWGKGRMYDPFTEKVCISGAIHLATGCCSVENGEMRRNLESPARTAMAQLLIDYLNTFIGDRGGYSVGLVTFNDSRATSADDILDLVQRGIKGVVQEMESR